VLYRAHIPSTDKDAAKPANPKLAGIWKYSIFSAMTSTACDLSLLRGRPPRSRCRAPSRISKPHLRSQLHMSLLSSIIASPAATFSALGLLIRLSSAVARVWLASSAVLFLSHSFARLTSPHPKRFAPHGSDHYSCGQYYYSPCPRPHKQGKRAWLSEWCSLQRR